MARARGRLGGRPKGLVDVGGTGARLNIVIDLEAKIMLKRLLRCYGVTLREALALALDRTETALLDTLPADRRHRAYLCGASVASGFKSARTSEEYRA